MAFLEHLLSEVECQNANYLLNIVSFQQHQTCRIVSWCCNVPDLLSVFTFSPSSRQPAIISPSHGVLLLWMSSKVLEDIWRLLEEFKNFHGWRGSDLGHKISFFSPIFPHSRNVSELHVPLTDMYGTNRAIEIVMEAKEGDLITTKVKSDSKKCLVKELKVAKHLHTCYLKRLQGFSICICALEVRQAFGGFPGIQAVIGAWNAYDWVFCFPLLSVSIYWLGLTSKCFLSCTFS